MFFVKTVLLTVALVLLMQIEVGDRTIENHAMSFVQSSWVTAPMNAAARGAAKLTRDLTHTISSKVKKNTKDVKKEERRASSSPSESEEYEGQE